MSTAVYESKDEKTLSIPPEESGCDLTGVTFTWRATLVGASMGCVVGAGNIYLGLKTGFGTSASLFSSIASFGIFKAVERAGGAHFGMAENCAAQTAASAAGSVSGGFIAPIPAMFRLGLLARLSESWPVLLIWTMTGSLFALFFAVPLRSYFIIQQNLPYPSPTAVAHTIRALHSGSEGDSTAQLKWIFGSFCASFSHRLLSLFMPFLAKTHLLYGIGAATGSDLLKRIDLFYGWKFEASGALVGAGVMLGINASLSIAASNTLLWGVLSPVLMSSGVVSDKSPFGFPEKGITVQSWGLWVGIVIVLCASLADILSQYSTLWKAAKSSFSSLNNLASHVLPLKRREVETICDPEPKENLVPTWLWASGMAVTGSVVLALLSLSFGLSIETGILAIVLGLGFSLVGCQCSATTDINPTGVLAKGSQVIFSALPAASPAAAQMSSLCAGALTASCATQAVDMVGDLKAGHLLKASPRGLVYSQLLGSVFGSFSSIGIFYLFASVYPCIAMGPVDGQVCEFPAPIASAWVGVTRALTSGIGSFIPMSCRIACLVFGLMTIVSTILKHTLLKKHAYLMPNWNAFGIGFFIPIPSMGYALLLGAVGGILFRRLNPAKWQLVGIVMAAGLMAGEGISGIFIALLSFGGITPNTMATGFACPDFSPAKC
ncbi:hypothetical protein DSO57_1013734 [Entomophthora muscae]|uniref:Uncharacterized protein n=1 Tax=Entomophthora muscae TaxID=34485 RepID=A0ACC2URK4_9FUNG|nr:hypothetical protein DSO57_1013734 [Entomophthora muscae]